MVERVVFIATPHRGSEMANRDIAGWRGLFALSPIAVADAIVDIVTDNYEDQSRRSGSIDNMSPGNAFLATLAAQPVAPRIKSRSTIAVRGIRTSRTSKSRGAPPTGSCDSTARGSTASPRS